ncbi:MOLTING PROTEIN MLT-4 [Salix koriyanagi]|uniref:MOLTING PROTEIN MLT-4 n=1 Tax=Salix koriyanagi TaxID=2511006 RepID=A0A9Q1A8M7_9ROSI|nr:MOLTING PROTEIN MLT-4 [Salix koriyanagi]
MDELSINIPRQPLNQRDETFPKWKAESFPAQTPSSYDPKKMMDKELCNYAEEDRFDELFDHLWRLSSMELSSIIYTQGSPSGNSLLHVSASHGAKDVTELLLQHFPSLMTGKNFHDDTALHLAAGAGQLETTKVLINKAKGHGEATDFYNILEVKNDRGNTALHEAVINGHHTVANSLVSECSELCYTENKEHESPLYLAVENNDEKMLSILMLAIPHDDDLLEKLKGKSPVHAAVQGRKREILEQIAEGKPELLRQKDEQGENLLHCAASLGYVLETQFLLKEYRDGAIQKNNEGNMPIHVASKEGHVGVVDAYNSEWSDLTGSLNTKRQNILHVAAERGRNEVVKHILENQNLEALINEQDLDGNTPLHLASMNGRSIATFYLVRDRNVVKDKANGEKLTPYEIAEKQSKIVELEFSGEQIPKGKGNQVGPDDRKGGEGILDYYGALMTLSVLHFWVGPKNRKVEYFRIKSRLPEKEIKDRISTLLVVSVLIASVTFAGVLQLPKSTDQPARIASNITTNSILNQGISEKTEAILRNVYIYSDMVALNASVMASIILCWAQLYDLKFAPFVIWFSSLMVGGAIYMMCMAFFFAVIIALGGSDYRVLALVIVVGSVFFLAQTLLYLQWILPPSVNQILERIISYHVYYLSFLLLFYSWRWLPDKLSELTRGRTSSGSNSDVDS